MFVDGWVRAFRHSQSFGAKVWDKGELTDFQELCLQRKTKTQRRDSGFQLLRLYWTWSSAPWGSDYTVPPKKTQASSP